MNALLSHEVARLRRHPEFQELNRWKWSAHEIKQVEKAIGFGLPTDLKEILLETGGFALSQTELYFSAHFSGGYEEEGEVQIMFQDFETVIDLHKTLVISPDNPGRLDPKYLVFGTADGGNSFLLTDAGGAIYYWPLAFDPIGEGDNAAGVAKVAGSMPEFIRGLRALDGSLGR